MLPHILPAWVRGCGGLANPLGSEGLFCLALPECAWDGTPKGTPFIGPFLSLRINNYLAGVLHFSPGLSMHSRAKKEKRKRKKWGHLRLSQGSKRLLDWRWRERPSLPGVSTSGVLLLLLPQRIIWVNMRKWPRSPGRKWGRLKKDFPQIKNRALDLKHTSKPSVTLELQNQPPPPTHTHTYTRQQQQRLQSCMADKVRSP